MTTRLAVALPASLPDFGRASIDQVHITPGMALTQGAPILDLTLDLSEGIAFDCPPVAHYRLIAGQPGIVEDVLIVADGQVQPHAVVAHIRVDTATAAATARVSAISIMQQRDWWDD